MKKVAKLKDELKKRRLKRIRKKEELQERPRAFIALAIEHGEYEEEKDVEERDVFETRVRIDSRSALVFNFQGRPVRGHEGKREDEKQASRRKIQEDGTRWSFLCGSKNHLSKCELPHEKQSCQVFQMPEVRAHHIAI